MQVFRMKTGRVLEVGGSCCAVLAAMGCSDPGQGCM